MFRKMQVRPPHKMRLYFHLGASKLTVLSLALLCAVPRTVTPYPRSPAGLLPALDGAELESTLLHLRALLGDPRRLVRPGAWAKWPRDPRTSLPNLRVVEEEEEEGGWEEEALRRDLAPRSLSPFLGGNSLESMNYQDLGEGENGGKMKEALTSIAGGLQAVSREKGGFGFRFGRKRWTDGGWVD